MTGSLQTRIKALAKDNLSTIIAARRHLHAYPERSFEEHATAQFIAQTLQGWGVSLETGVGGTGVVATVVGGLPGGRDRVVALRADIDALPIHEANAVPYRSTRPGVMHACGHDAHTASLLGSVRILHALQEYFSGIVRCIFQPGEEEIPGGALAMIQAGVIANPRPHSILGQHVDPTLPVGKVGFCIGPSMASGDELYFTVQGRGGHASKPHLLVDPVLMAAHIIIALQQVVSRNYDPFSPVVLSLGKVVAQGATNVIPNEVQIAGTFRAMNETLRRESHAKITRIAQETAAAMGGSCKVEIRKGYPCLVNDTNVVQRAQQAAVAFLGNDQVVSTPPMMAAEDFAYYLHHVPGCFYMLGVRNEPKAVTSALHTDTFDIDEQALEVGMGLMTWLALNELSTLF